MDHVQAVLLSTSVQEVDLISCGAPWGGRPDPEEKTEDIGSLFWMNRVGREQVLEQ